MFFHQGDLNFVGNFQSHRYSRSVQHNLLEACSDDFSLPISALGVPLPPKNLENSFVGSPRYRAEVQIQIGVQTADVWFKLPRRILIIKK